MLVIVIKASFGVCVEVRVELWGALLRIKVVGGGREVEAVGPVSDFPNVLGLLVAQMAREGFSVEEVCSVLRTVGEKKAGG